MSTAANVIRYLETHNFKRENGNNWRGSSPWRNNSNSNGLVVTIDNDEHGTWYDHARDEGGSLYDFCERTGIEIEGQKRTEVADTKRSYKDLADYAKEHGVETSVFEAAGWKLVNRYDGEHKCERPALEFPTQGGRRFRFIDGLKPPFRHEGINGEPYKSCWYGFKNMPEIADASGLPLVLTNGEPSVVAAQHYGIPAVCVTSSGEKAIADYLLEELRSVWSGRIVIALDCDDKGRRTAQTLKDQLSDYVVSVVDLKLSDKGDLADFCKMHGPNAASNLMKLAKFEVAKDDTKQAAAAVELAQALNGLTAGIKGVSTREEAANLEVQIAKAEAAIARVKSNATVTQSVTASQVGQRVRSLYLKVRSGETKVAMSTGYDHWDRLMNGGFRNGLNVIAGIQGSGKSTLGASLAGRMIQRGLSGYMVTTEMSPDEWYTKLWASMARVQYDELVNGSYNAAYDESVTDMANRIDSTNTEFCEQSAPSVASIRPTILKLVAEKRIDFVMVDSATNMRAPGVSGDLFSQNKAVMDGLMELAREINRVAGPDALIPVIANVQANANEVKARDMKAPTMLDIFGGQTSSQNAGSMTVLHYPHWFVGQGYVRPEDADPDWPADRAMLIVRKMRFGKMVADQPCAVRFVSGMGHYHDERPIRSGIHGPKRKAIKSHHDADEEYDDIEF
jgi:replicative DNA helicase